MWYGLLLLSFGLGAFVCSPAAFVLGYIVGCLTADGRARQSLGKLLGDQANKLQVGQSMHLHLSFSHDDDAQGFGGTCSDPLAVGFRRPTN